jgi:LysR family hydrogen peroxide-inducible transcriptional activator
MTLQQLEYILALDKTRHFVRAAEMCKVTQPTLSAMVQKLEDELDCRIFDRSTHPLVPTEVGQQILKQAQVVLFHANQLKENLKLQRGTVDGPLSLAIIPTVAPYLLPMFISVMRESFPAIQLKVTETRTDVIIQQLLKAEIDMALLSTPLNDPKILEVPLYYEKFVAYVSPEHPLYDSPSIASNEMPTDNLWVLEEGHCLRNQVFNFCNQAVHQSSVYEAGSIDTLVKIVDHNGGYTVIPELHMNLLTEDQRKNLRPLIEPDAVREIALVIRHDFVKEGLVNAVADSIKKIIPQHMLDSHLKKFAIKL